MSDECQCIKCRPVRYAPSQVKTVRISKWRVAVNALVRKQALEEAAKVAEKIYNRGQIGSDIECGRYDPYKSFNYDEVEGGLYKKTEYIAYEWSGIDNMYSATHWMPLPPPPEGKADE